MFKWVKDRTGTEASFRVVFYPAEYNKRMLGIFPIGDPIPYIPEQEVRLKARGRNPDCHSRDAPAHPSISDIGGTHSLCLGG